MVMFHLIYIYVYIERVINGWRVALYVVIYFYTYEPSIFVHTINKPGMFIHLTS